MNKTILSFLPIISLFLSLNGDPFTTPSTPFVPGTLNEVTVLPNPPSQGKLNTSGIWDINLDLKDPLSLTSLYVGLFNIEKSFEDSKILNELADENNETGAFADLNAKCAQSAENLESWYACMNDDAAIDLLDARGFTGSGTGSSFFFGFSGFGTGGGGSIGSSSGSSSSSSGSTGGSGNGSVGGGGGVTTPPPVTSPGVPVPEPLTILVLGGMAAAGAYLKNRNSAE